MTQNTPPEPFIWPPTVHDMDAEQHEKMLDHIREKRMQAVHIHQETLAAKERAASEKAQQQLERQCELLGKAIDRMTKALEAVEKKSLEVRALRLTLGLD